MYLWYQSARCHNTGSPGGASPMWGSLVHIMAFHLFSLQPLPEPILTCQFNPFKQTSVIVSSKCSKFHSTKCISKCLLQQLSHFVLSWLVLILPVNTVLTVWFTWWVGGLRVSALEPVVCHQSMPWFAMKMIWLNRDDYSCVIWNHFQDIKKLSDKDL